ncbi:MAG: helix-turn-helix domain-containing protein [Candidatus Lokiarchaeota archaeon]|nr:helix-turn-helix domain-containing protein [Candidatus Harpocratesius repetitus]
MSGNEKNNIENIDDLTKLLADETNFEIILSLFIYQELTLSQLEEYIQKSRSTIHRHLQLLKRSELIKESKEVKVRSHIPAKYYSVNMQKLLQFPKYSMQDLQKLSDIQKQELFKTISQTYNSILVFMIKIIQKTQKILSVITQNPNKPLVEILDFQDPKLFMSLSVMTEKQRELYLTRLFEFSQKFYAELQEKHLFDPQNLGKEKFSYLLFHTIVPIEKLNNSDKSQ